MADYCALHDIQLLPYGTVAGGFLSDRYLGVPASKSVPLPSSLPAVHQGVRCLQCTRECAMWASPGPGMGLALCCACNTC